MEISIKYRRLDLHELENLEPEFIQFLASNGVDAQKWLTLKGENPAIVDGIISQFSNIVFDKILEKVSLIESRSEQAIYLYLCTAEEIVMHGVKLRNKQFDFDQIGEVIDSEKLINTNFEDLQIMSGSKPYAGDRKKEIFEMLQQGCMISPNQDFYDYLNRLTTNK